MDLLDGLDVELVFAFDVFYVFFDFDKIGSKCRPALRLQNRPKPDTARIDTNGGKLGTERMPLGRISTDKVKKAVDTPRPEITLPWFPLESSPNYPVRVPRHRCGGSSRSMQ